jgi:hypothetical protein
MKNSRNSHRTLVLAAALLWARVSPAQLSNTRWLPATTETPEAFGTTGYTRTSISALSFGGTSYIPVVPLSRAGVPNVDQHFYATLDLPQGAIIDFMGISNYNDGNPYVIGASLWKRTPVKVIYLGGVSNTPHSSWVTDRNSTPAGIPVSGFGTEDILVVDVEIVASPNFLAFGFVDFFWRRTVSPAPGSAFFNDVPTTHPYFQFIEALRASGITGGCQAEPPLYCPNAPVTRGQMAAFLAKALGLHWPY